MTVIHNDDDDDADADDGAIMVWLEKQDRWCVLFLLFAHDEVDVMIIWQEKHDGLCVLFLSAG